MLRYKFHEILRDAIIKYIHEVDPEIGNSITGYIVNAGDDLYTYNLQVSKIEEFPIWQCSGGDTPPTQGCGKIIDKSQLVELLGDGETREPDQPTRCSFCGGTEFTKFESEEEFRDAYEYRLEPGES